VILEDGFEYYESKMNQGVKDDFDVVESISTFAHKSFSEQIKDNLQFYGMTVESLSKSINISSFRLSALLSGNASFERFEIDLIKRRLHL